MNRRPPWATQEMLYWKVEREKHIFFLVLSVVAGGRSGSYADFCVQRSLLSEQHRTGTILVDPGEQRQGKKRG